MFSIEQNETIQTVFPSPRPRTGPKSRFAPEKRFQVKTICPTSHTRENHFLPKTDFFMPPGAPPTLLSPTTQWQVPAVISQLPAVRFYTIFPGIGRPSSIYSGYLKKYNVSSDEGSKGVSAMTRAKLQSLHSQIVVGKPYYFSNNKIARVRLN